MFTLKAEQSRSDRRTWTLTMSSNVTERQSHLFVCAISGQFVHFLWWSPLFSATFFFTYPNWDLRITTAACWDCKAFQSTFDFWAFYVKLTWRKHGLAMKQQAPWAETSTRLPSYPTDEQDTQAARNIKLPQLLFVVVLYIQMCMLQMFHSIYAPKCSFCMSSR